MTQRLFLLVLVALFLLNTGCTPTSAPTPAAVLVLPTQAVLAPPPAALIAAATLTPISPSAADTMPPTWTPVGRVSEGYMFVDPNATVPPTRTPTPIPTYPSRTPTATSTPTVTATPTRFVLPKLPPSTELGPSKLGIHVIQNNHANIMDFVRRAQPIVIKAVNDFGFLAEVKQVSPRTVTVGRVEIGAPQNYVGVPEEEARKFVEANLETYRANPWVDYWEGWNEPDPNLENMGWYARFEAERCKLMSGYGFRPAIGGFATGVPEYEEFFLFLPAVRAAQAYGGVLTLHEYSAPDMTYLYGTAWAGKPAYADRGLLTFRYRWFYRDILQPMGLVIPLIITEAGVDGIIGNRPGPQGSGWQDFAQYWVQQGWGNSGPEAFINQLAWYDAGVRQDGYVIGFTIFTAGAIAQWEKYNINTILPDLANYVLSQNSPAP